MKHFAYKSLAVLLVVLFLALPLQSINNYTYSIKIDSFHYSSYGCFGKEAIHLAAQCFLECDN